MSQLAPYTINAANSELGLLNPYSNLYTNNSTSSGYPWLQPTNKDNMLAQFGKKPKSSKMSDVQVFRALLKRMESHKTQTSKKVKVPIYTINRNTIEQVYHGSGKDRLNFYYKVRGKYLKMPNSKIVYYNKQSAQDALRNRSVGRPTSKSHKTVKTSSKKSKKSSKKSSKMVTSKKSSKKYYIKSLKNQFIPGYYFASRYGIIKNKVRQLYEQNDHSGHIYYRKGQKFVKIPKTTRVFSYKPDALKALKSSKKSKSKFGDDSESDEGSDEDPEFEGSFGARGDVYEAGFCIAQSKVKKVYKKDGKPGKYYYLKRRFVKVPPSKACFKTRLEASRALDGLSPRRKRSYSRRRYAPRRYSRRRYSRWRWRPIIRHLIPLPRFFHINPSKKIHILHKIDRTEVDKITAPSSFGNTKFNYTINQYATNAATPTQESLYRIGSEYFRET